MTAGSQPATPSLLPTRLASTIEALRLPIELAAISGALAIFLVSTLPNLANYPAITDDEMWVFASAAKLAREGIFGTDMFSGFYNAESRYYFNMPAHHLVVAAAFKLFGAGVLQARLVGVCYGIATLLLTYALARRLYGVPAAILSLGLLLFLRLNMGFDTGLPLQELAVNMRYDLAPVPFMLGGCLVLLGGATWRRALVAGLLFGIATLMQFYGAFMVPIAVAYLWFGSNATGSTDRSTRLKLVAALVAATAVVGLPYGAYIAAHYDDFKGQAGTIDRRADFTSPAFYLDNLLDEPNRFVRPLAIPPFFDEVTAGQDPLLVSPHRVPVLDALPRRPSAKLGVLVGLPLALAFTTARYLQTRRREDLLLPLCLAALVVQYTLLESTKFYYYWLPVVPFLCIGIAYAVLRLLQPARHDATRLALLGATLLALLVVFGEGSVARLSGLRTATNAGSYEALSHELHDYVPAGSRVVGSTALWGAMQDTDYRSYFLLFYLTRPNSGPYRSTITDYLDSFRPQYVVLTRLASSELQKHLVAGDYAEWQAYMSAHAQKVARLDGPDARKAYTYVEIWKLE